MVQGQENDNTFKTLARFYFYASKLEQDEDTFFKAAFLIHGLQGIFLRSRLYKDKFDFYDKAQRDNLIDNLVEKLFGGEKLIEKSGLYLPPLRAAQLQFF